MSPIQSICTFIRLLFQSKVKNDKFYVDKRFCIQNHSYLVFRNLTVGDQDNNPSSVVLVLRFQFYHSSLKRDRIASFFQIPLFAGIPGFQAKLWTFDEKSGFFQGVYQWESLAHAEAYLNSFAVDFIRKKAVEDSISYELNENIRLKHFISERLLKE